LYYAENKGKAPVIDVMKAGYMKVCGKGVLPAQPVIVKARYFTKEAENKIKEVKKSIKSAEEWKEKSDFLQERILPFCVGLAMFIAVGYFYLRDGVQD